MLLSGLLNAGKDAAEQNLKVLEKRKQTFIYFADYYFQKYSSVFFTWGKAQSQMTKKGS